jgi:hypothetical protein
MPQEKEQMRLKEQFTLLRELLDPWVIIAVSLFSASFIVTMTLVSKKDTTMAGISGLLNILAYICISVWVRNTKQKRVEAYIATKVPIKNVSVKNFPAIPLDTKAQEHITNYIKEQYHILQDIMTQMNDKFTQLKSMVDHLPQGKHTPQKEELYVILHLRTSIFQFIHQFTHTRDQLQLFCNAFKITEHPHQTDLESFQTSINSYQQFITTHFKLEQVY